MVCDDCFTHLGADRRTDEQIKVHFAFEVVLLHVICESERHDLGVVDGREARPADRLPVLEEWNLRNTALSKVHDKAYDDCIGTR